MYYNDIISEKIRVFVARLQRQSTRRNRPFREVTEIMPLLQDAQKNESVNIGIEEDSRSGKALYN